jgi:hypothetical protein
MNCVRFKQWTEYRGADFTASANSSFAVPLHKPSRNTQIQNH